MGDGRFPFEMVNGVPVVAAPEEIDITSAPALRSALLEAAAHGHGTLVADMTLTQFCDSSGLHALLAAHKHAQAGGGELLLVIPAIAVLRVFAITGMDRVIPNFTSLDQALAQHPTTGRTATGELTAHLRTAKRTGSSRSTALASWTEKPADRDACASVARRAPGGPDERYGSAVLGQARVLIAAGG
jgi:anti-sigma B factor antagonist